MWYAAVRARPLATKQTHELIFTPGGLPLPRPPGLGDCLGGPAAPQPGGSGGAGAPQGAKNQIKILAKGQLQEGLSTETPPQKHRL